MAGVVPLSVAQQEDLRCYQPALLTQKKPDWLTSNVIQAAPTVLLFSIGKALRSPNVFHRLSPRWIRDIWGTFHLARQTHAGGRDHWRTQSSWFCFNLIRSRRSSQSRCDFTPRIKQFRRISHARTHTRHKGAPQFPTKQQNALGGADASSDIKAAGGCQWHPFDIAHTHTHTAEHEAFSYPHTSVKSHYALPPLTRKHTHIRRALSRISKLAE